MEFATNYKRPGRFMETFTKKEQPQYRQEIDRKTGKRVLVEKGTIDIYEKIQEYAEDTKLQNILSKYNVQMLSNNLKNSEQELIDLSNMPENLLETMTVIDNAKYLWERQSTEIKQKFNNDFKQFIASSENGQLAEMLNKELKTDLSHFSQLNEAQKAQIISNNGIAQPVAQNPVIDADTTKSNTIPVAGGTTNV